MNYLNKKTIEDIDVNGKKVLVRCDFNVPLADGVITDDKRIRESIPTIRYLADHGAAVILCSHLGRPKEDDEESKKKATLAPVAKRLAELMGREVHHRYRGGRSPRHGQGAEARRDHGDRKRPLLQGGNQK